MDAEAMKQTTIGEALVWVNMLLDYTDKVAALIPEDKLDWRPDDPNGDFQFSLAEITMHCADARRMFASQLSGADASKEYWATSEGPNDEGVWTFKPYGSKQAILDSLLETRVLYADWLALPVDRLLEVTEGSQQSFEKQLEWMREHDQPTELAERRGPANINRVLMALIGHESGHRGSLYTLLRMQGVKLPDDVG